MARNVLIPFAVAKLLIICNLTKFFGLKIECFLFFQSSTTSFRMIFYWLSMSILSVSDRKITKFPRHRQIIRIELSRYALRITRLYLFFPLPRMVSITILPTLRSIPALVVGIPVLRVNSRLALVTPKALFHEKLNPGIFISIHNA